MLFVLISRLRIAELSSERTVEAPCIDVPPVMLIFALEGAGEFVREVSREEGLLLDLRSEMKGPAADGGARGVGLWKGVGLFASVKLLRVGLAVVDARCGM